MERTFAQKSFRGAVAASFAGLVCFALFACLAGVALADVHFQTPSPADIEPIRVVVHAPAGCPNSGGFLEAVKMRTGRVRAANPGEAARTFRVEIKDKRGTGPKPTFGQLFVEDVDGGAPDTREIRGASCFEVETALELIAALAIDPDAQMNTRGGPAAGANEDAGAATADAANAAGEADGGPAEEDAATNADGLITLATPLEVPSRPWSFAVGAGFDLVGSGQAPISPGARVYGETRAPDNGRVTPSFRLTLSYFSTTTAVVDEASATFHWFLAQGEICPVRVTLGEPIVFVPCAAFEVGVLHASSIGTVGFASANRPWFAAGPIGRVELDVAAPLFFDVWGGLRFPFVREVFTFNEDLRVYRAPPAIVSGGIDVGVRFP